MRIKTALVTGGTDGVGLSIVRALVAAQYEVHFVGLSDMKGRALARELSALTDQRIRFWCVDLSDMIAVNGFIDAFIADIPQLDRLVCSAGLVSMTRLETAQKFERTFAVNYLSAYALTNRLLPLLARAERARVLLVSGSHPIALKQIINFEDVHAQQRYQGIKALGQAINAKTVLAQVLHERWSDNNIVVNAVHPGFVRSRLGRHFPWGMDRVIRAAVWLLSNESALGIKAAVSPDFEGVSGYYLFGDQREPLMFPAAYCARLEQLSTELLTCVEHADDV
ncbi:MAG: SDR family NAD(P)-dependent oxidoreductase [Pseudomonadota bacterium]